MAVIGSASREHHGRRFLEAVTDRPAAHPDGALYALRGLDGELEVAP